MCLNGERIEENEPTSRVLELGTGKYRECIRSAFPDPHGAVGCSSSTRAGGTRSIQMSARPGRK